MAVAALVGSPASTADEGNDLRPAADRLAPLAVKEVTIRDTFWAPRLEVNRTRTLDHVLKEIESTGGLQQLRHRRGQGDAASSAARSGPIRTSTSGSKARRGRWRSTRIRRSTRRWTAIIARIAAAQQPDGYLDTFVQINVPDLKFKNFAFFHEDFSSGHLFEAGGGALPGDGQEDAAHGRHADGRSSSTASSGRARRTTSPATKASSWRS